MLARRAFALSVAGAALAAAVSVRARAATADLVYVGMHGTHITAARFDPVTGTLALIGPVAEIPNPTWTAVHPALPVLYAASEIGNDGLSHGSVYAFRIDRTSGALTKIAAIDAGGGGTTFLWLDAVSNTLLAANYGSGSVAAIPVGRDGSLGAVAALVTETGSGPSPRQKSAHAHAALVDPSGRFVLVADLGADRVFVYPFDRATHTVRTDPPGHERHYVAAPGSGPRHLTFHPNGRTLYVFNELSADLSVLTWNAAAGMLTLAQTLATNSPAFSGKSAAAELAVSRDGRFVYVSNRGEDTLVAFAADPASGALTLMQGVAAGGDPWSFTMHPSGRWMLVANEKTNRIDTVQIDPAGGRMTDTGATVTLPNPVCISFIGTA